MNNQIRIFLVIILSFILIHINYRMFFVHYDNKLIELHSGYLDSNPQLISPNKGSFWQMSINNKKFELRYINLGIKDSEIKKIRKGEKITLYSYNSFSMMSLFDYLNGRTTVLGIKTNNIVKNKSFYIINNVKSMDFKGFIFINPFVFLALYAIYEDYKKKKTENRKP